MKSPIAKARDMAIPTSKTENSIAFSKKLDLKISLNAIENTSDLYNSSYCIFGKRSTSSTGKRDQVTNYLRQKTVIFHFEKINT
jgi:hypothetical protein